MANSTSSSPQRSSLSLRKTNKPLMEKRRRARINDSLTQLKSLVIQGTKKDSSQFNKLEKADILELTVKHLRNLQEQQQLSSSRDTSLTGKYQAGFMECANEVIRYLGQTQSFSDDVKSRVVHHLASCIQLSSKTSFAKPSQPATVPVTTSVVSNGIQTNTQFTNGQIIQLVSPFQTVKTINTTQNKVSQPVPIAPATSTSTHIPVFITSDLTSTAASTVSSRIKFTQPLHIQIPPVLSPVIIQSKVPQNQKPVQQPQAIHKIQDPLPRIRCAAPQETIVSSSTISPDATNLSPPTAANHSYVYYSPEDHYLDHIPRSRTYSFASSASSDSDLTSPLNLSQSPHYYDQKDINYCSPLNSHLSQASTADKSSPTHNFPRHSLYSSHFPSVIVDARKTMDSHSLKYLHVMDEDRMCFRHDGTSSPASSVGEERLWRPW